MTDGDELVFIFSITPMIGTDSSFKIANDFLTVSSTTFEPVATIRNRACFSSRITSRVVSPMPGGISIMR